MIWKLNKSATFNFVVACRLICMMWETLPVIDHPWQNSDLLLSARELYQSPVKWISFQIKGRFRMLIALLHQMTGTKMEEDPNISCQ
jgi:hypothetical protein